MLFCIYPVACLPLPSSLGTRTYSERVTLIDGARLRRQCLCFCSLAGQIRVQSPLVRAIGLFKWDSTFRFPWSLGLPPWPPFLYSLRGNPQANWKHIDVSFAPLPASLLLGQSGQSSCRLSLSPSLCLSNCERNRSSESVPCQ